MISKVVQLKTVAGLLISAALLFLTACSDADKETKLVDLFTAASLDIIEISFTDSAESIVSIDTFVDYTIEGLKSNGVDAIPVAENTVWSVSEGAASTIDQTGRLSTGSIAETLTITAKVGELTATFDVMVSAAKFDQVVMLHSETVTVNMCQSQVITPIGSYLNDDGSEEIRPVDNSIIGTITWLIRNQEDDAPSQRAFIKTENNQTRLQAYETGDVIIQAQAQSVSSGTTVTSVDFAQTLDNNLNSIKLCRQSDTDLAACTLSDPEVEENGVLALQAVGNYQASDGSTINQNVSELAKWGTDDDSVLELAFSTDRQQMDVTGLSADESADVSVACGDIEQVVSDSDIENGVVLPLAVTCVNGSLTCFADDALIDVVAVTLTSLSVRVNDLIMVDNSTLELASRPSTIIFEVEAVFSDDSTEVITTDTDTVYSNLTIGVITNIANVPGEFTVLSSGLAEVEITYQGQSFTARIDIP